MPKEREKNAPLKITLLKNQRDAFRQTEFRKSQAFDPKRSD